MRATILLGPCSEVSFQGNTGCLSQGSVAPPTVDERFDAPWVGRYEDRCQKHHAAIMATQRGAALRDHINQDENGPVRPMTHRPALFATEGYSSVFSSPDSSSSRGELPSRPRRAPRRSPMVAPMPLETPRGRDSSNSS